MARWDLDKVLAEFGRLLTADPGLEDLRKNIPSLKQLPMYSTWQNQVVDWLRTLPKQHEMTPLTRLSTQLVNSPRYRLVKTIEMLLGSKILILLQRRWSLKMSLSCSTWLKKAQMS